jgi:hypothetical protein
MANAKLSDRTGRRSDERSEKRRALAVRSNDLFAVQRSKGQSLYSQQKLGVARFYIAPKLWRNSLLLGWFCSTGHESRLQSEVCR